MSKVRANNFTNKVGTGAPTFPYGVNVTGVATATTVSATTAPAASTTLQQMCFGLQILATKIILATRQKIAQQETVTLIS